MRHIALKTISAILCAVALTVGILGGIFSLNWYFDDGDDFYASSLCWRVTSSYHNAATELAEKWNSSFASRQERVEDIKEKLSAGHTNFRFRLLDDEGTLLWTNVPEGQSLEDAVYQVHGSMGEWYNDAYISQGMWHLDYGVAAPLEVEDAYTAALGQYELMRDAMTHVPPVSAACLVLGLLLLIYLLAVCTRRPGREEAVLNLHDRIPYDLYLCLSVILIALCWGLALLEGINYLQWNSTDWFGVAWVGTAALGTVVLCLALLLTTAARIKARTLLRNTILWRLCRVIKGAAGRAYRALPMVWRAVVVFLLYLLGAALTGATVILAVPYQALALFLICRWVYQWQQIRAATGAIVLGRTDVKIDTDKFYPDLCQHAVQLNDLGSAIDNAVDERMKSERFKAELITNVSHDLKTPLTSIINYVDLLKKEDVENPTAREYIQVLDRKSQRLKKLTEDLVEASKASTGALTVNKERLDLAQLVRQATGEYEEKLAAAGLTLVTTLPEGEAAVNADGRHVWRVLDNLLGNCAKYALEGTRIYLELACWNGSAVITMKNISRQPLNIPAEQLAERFVRGDESRTTEGSGLGLSIARSLTELQGGQFTLDIDGDLFKAKVAFPLAKKE